LVGLLIGCQWGEQDLSARIEEIVVRADSTLLASDDLSEPHMQRKRWRVRNPGSWSDFYAVVARELSEEDFQVETLEHSLVARKTTETDRYQVEIRLMSSSGLGAEHTAEIDFIGYPF